MTKVERIEALAALPEIVKKAGDLSPVFEMAKARNGFFIPEFCDLALKNVLSWHDKSVLENWLSEGPESNQPKKVGLVLAGNLPLVGWHDLLAVVASGHLAYYKPSTQDEVLIDWLIGLLTSSFPGLGNYFQKQERLNGVDAIIATGSNATASHFNFYFKEIPRLIRGSKSSLGVIYGFESVAELEPLVDDIMMYFGLGCRNVTKILVPEGYDLHPFMQALKKYKYFADHNKYANNCIYHQAIFLMNGDPFFESDVLIVRAEKSLFSPVGVMNFQEYSSLDEAVEIVVSHQNETQCVVSHKGQFGGSIPFGTTQSPTINQYADGVDTLAFLRKLN